MPAEATGLAAAAEDTSEGKSFPVAGVGVASTARGSSGRHNNSSSQQEQRGCANTSASSINLGKVSLLQEMRALQEKLEADIHYLEGKIHEMETDYLAAPAEVGNMIKGWEGYVLVWGELCLQQSVKCENNTTEFLITQNGEEEDVLQPAPLPVASSSWGGSNASSAVSHASGSSQRHGGGGGSSVGRSAKRSHTKSSTHGGGSSRKSTAKCHAAAGDLRSEGRGESVEESGRSERSTGGVVSDHRCA